MSQPDASHETDKTAESEQTAVSAYTRVTRRRLSLREYLAGVTVAMLTVGLVITAIRLRRSEVEVARLRSEVARLRMETGHLRETEPGKIAAARVPSEQPLTYRLRIRVPEHPSRFRVAYSSLWPKQSSSPQWYGAVPVPSGESVVTLQIMEDPRDRRWKIVARVASSLGTKRMTTVLPEDHVEIFCGSHEVVSAGVGRETTSVVSDRSIRLLDERWLVGEGSLLLYGDRAPDRDQIGIYAELQPDVGPL